MPAWTIPYTVRMWFPLALAAAFLWGLHYTFSEQVFKHISVVTELAFVALASGTVFGLFSLLSGHMKKDVATLTAQPRVLTLLIMTAAAFILADLLISVSIVDRNATLASIIEISYPFFVALFSYLLFSETNMNIGAAVGAALILSGVAVVYVFNH